MVIQFIKPDAQMTIPKTDPWLLEALASLNEIGATVNQIGAGRNG